MKKLKSTFFLLLRLGVTLGILVFLYTKIDIDKLSKIFKNINFFFYFLALVCFNGFQILVAFRWKKICASWGFNERFTFFLKSYLMCFSLNTLLPGIVGGDLLRTYFLTKRGLSLKKASFSVVLDRFYGLIGIFMILAIFLPFYGYFLPSEFFIFLVFTTYSVILLLILISFILTKFSKVDYFKPLSFPCNIYPIFLGFLIQILFVIQFILLRKAIHFEVDDVYLFVIIPIISFLSALPISISGLGVREGGLGYFLTLLNYSVEYGVALGILGYTLIVFSSLPGLFFYLRGKSTWK